MTGGGSSASVSTRQGKPAIVGRGDGWVNRPDAGMGKIKSISPSRSKVKDQPVLEIPCL